MMSTGDSPVSRPAPEVVLELKGVSHWFGKKRVLYDVSFKVARGEIVALVGPSGCGKSTLLRAILGTHPPKTGEILMNAVPVTHPGRDRGIVYQRYSLYPFLTAEANVAFGPMVDETDLVFRFFRFRKWRELRRRHIEKARALLEKLELGAALEQYPAEMSGGMRQRVAVAQALIMKPQLLLLDEPFGALDEATREDLQAMLLELYAENLAARREGRPPPHTILIVTHELNEALYVADRVMGLSQHWDWRGDGLPEAPGATILYDRLAPVFAVGERPEYEDLMDQRDEIRRIAFEPPVPTKRGEHVSAWDDILSGHGQGILAP